MKQITKLCMLVAAIIFCGTANVWADDMNYMFRSWNSSTKLVESEERTATNPTPITSSTTEIGNGNWYVVSGNVTNNNRIVVRGAAHLILADGCELTCPKGITVAKDRVLYIYGQTGDTEHPYGTGKLTITEPDAGNAGLGGSCDVTPDNQFTVSDNWDNGTVSIHGGQLMVRGSNWSAAIGGGWMQRSCKLTILGGEVEANGGEDGAGIGSGCFSWCYSKDYLGADTGWTKIYGGKVTAKGGDSGAGIGGGSCRHVGKIEIFGGTVEAHGGWGGAGIGGGSEMDGSSTYNNTENTGIFIDGTTLSDGTYSTNVFAYGNQYAAGIGGGYGDAECGDGGKITISGGRVIAKGGEFGAGIGGSINAGLRSLTISGGDVEATGGDYAAGIGSGEISTGKNVNINISGGIVRAEGGTDAAGIGMGEYDSVFGSETSSNVNVTISGGNVSAFGKDNGAGIGGGEDGRKGGFFKITGGTVYAQAGGGCTGTDAGEGSAIGCGEDVSDKGNVSLCGTFDIAKGIKVTSERPFTVPERKDACVWRSYVTLEPCTEHSRPDTYTVIDDTYHSKKCVYCGDDELSAHTYTDGTCVCGMSQNGNNLCEIRVIRKNEGFSENYNLDPYNSQTNIYGYSTETKFMGSEYILPEYDGSTGLIEKQNGYIFDGWQVYTTEPTATNCMRGQGETVYNEGGLYNIPQSTVIYVCARYKYYYYPKIEIGDDKDGWTWTWDDVNKTYSAATLLLECKAQKEKHKDDTGYNATQYEKTIQAGIEQSDVIKNTTGDPAYYFYCLAFATFDDVEHINQKEVALPNLVVLDDQDDNGTIIGQKNDGNADDVYLEDRVLYKDNSWNTLCLPFGLSSFEGTPLEGATVKTLSEATYENGTLTLTFSDDLNCIEAGKPYIVKWEKPTNPQTYDGTNEHTTTDLYSPTFWGVNITASTAGKVEGNAADFVGQFAPKDFHGVDYTVLFLGGGNTLYYPNAPMSIGAQRAYFQLKGLTAGEPNSKVRNIVLNFDDEETGISSISAPILNGGEWFDLNGRKLNGKPTTKGLYINNGRKVVIK